MTSNFVFLLNVVRDIVPAFDTREDETSLFIFLPDFVSLQISLRILVLFSETWNLSSEIIDTVKENYDFTAGHLQVDPSLPLASSVILCHPLCPYLQSLRLG